MASDAQTARAHAVVTGMVQGVGYRMYAMRRASMLGLTGFARNLDDGAVEVVVEGPRSLVERYLAVLQRGPHSARVDDLRTEWGVASAEFSRFSIRK